MLGLFYIFYILDKSITHKNISLDASNEANPLVRISYKYLPRSIRLLASVAYILAVTFIAIKLPLFYGFWFISVFTMGHVVGFLSWTKLNIYRGRKLRWNLVFIAIVCFCVIAGYLNARIWF